MPNLSSQSTTLKISFSGQVQKSVSGDDYNPLSQTINIRKSVGPFTTSIANNAALGADEFYSALTLNVANGTPATVDLTSVTDFLGQSSVSFARVKAYMIRLISSADDATNGTLCSGITVNGSGGTNLAVLPGIANATLGNGDVLCWATNSATGTAVSGTTKNIYIANNDASHTASVQITIIGATT